VTAGLGWIWNVSAMRWLRYLATVATVNSFPVGDQDRTRAALRDQALFATKPHLARDLIAAHYVNR
jgi:hypothetical protein